jgi:hypothetical protein
VPGEFERAECRIFNCTMSVLQLRMWVCTYSIAPSLLSLSTDQLLQQRRPSSYHNTKRLQSIPTARNTWTCPSPITGLQCAPKTQPITACAQVSANALAPHDCAPASMRLWQCQRQSIMCMTPQLTWHCSDLMYEPKRTCCTLQFEMVCLGRLEPKAAAAAPHASGAQGSRSTVWNSWLDETHSWSLRQVCRPTPFALTEGCLLAAVPRSSRHCPNYSGTSCSRATTTKPKNRAAYM